MTIFRTFVTWVKNGVYFMQKSSLVKKRENGVSDTKKVVGLMLD